MIKRLIFVVTIFICLSLFGAAPSFARSQDIIRMNADIDIPSGMVVNDVVAIGGNVTVSGRVESNLVSVGGSVTLMPKAYVGGEIVIVGGEIAKDPASTIIGKVTQIYMPHFIPSITGFLKEKWIALWATISLLVLLGFLGLAILLAALIPEHVGIVVNALEKSFVMMLLFGLIWMILIVPIAVLLAISIIGIVLIPLEILLVVIALIIGYISSAVFIGKNIILSFRKVTLPFVDAIFGILVLFLIGFVPIVGPIIKGLFVIAGFGAVLTTRFGTTK